MYMNHKKILTEKIYIFLNRDNKNNILYEVILEDGRIWTFRNDSN